MATYRGHSKVALEPSPNTVVNTLGLAPCRVQALEPVALMAHEALGACKATCSSTFAVLKNPSPSRDTIFHSERGEKRCRSFGESIGWGETLARGTYASSRSGCAS